MNELDSANSTQLPEDFQELVLKHCDQRLSEDEAARLSALLRGNVEAQRHFLRLASIHARLSWEFGPRELPSLAKPSEMATPAAVSPARSTTKHRTTAFALAAALACIVAGLVLGPRFFPAQPQVAKEGNEEQGNEKKSAAGPNIATLSGGVNAVWEGPARTIGDWLAAGSMQLRSGVAEITFKSGVVAVIEGPADLDVLADRCFLRSGRLVARVPQQAIGFVVETSRLKVVDLGTEFGVSAEGEQGQSVQVYQGEVIATLKPDASQPAVEPRADERLESGQAFCVPLAGEANTTPFIPDRFVRHLPGPEDPSGRGKYPSNDARHEEVQIFPAPAKMTIDADLAEWDRRGEFESACIAPFDAHYAVAGMLMYDAQNLYIGARVKDPFPLRSQVSPHVARELYGHGGCIALRLSTDRGMGWPIVGEHADIRKGRPAEPADLNDRLVFAVLWFYEPEKLACLQLKHGMDYHGAQVNPPGYRGAYRKTPEGDGYFVEYAIPWSLLGAASDPPRAGDTLGCTWLVHWSDAEGRNWQGQLVDVVNPKETGWNFLRAPTWGRAVYK